MTRRLRPLGLGLLFLAAACSRSGPPTYPVAGTVTWNGSPLAEGDMVFEPIDGSVAPNHGKVLNGRFSFPAHAGKKWVRIYATREGEYDHEMQARARHQFLPEHCNAKTTLEAEVISGGENRFRYELREQP